jgi:hypothetical protein
VTTLKLRNWVVVNNLFATIGGTSQVDLSTNNYSSSDVLFDWNIVGNGRVNYMTTISDLSGLSSLGYTHNSTIAPGFSGLLDFHTLSSTSGTNLSSWLSVAPELNLNLDGTARDSSWPIGAYGTGPNRNTNDATLKLWFRFDSLLGFVRDDSGNHATGIQESSDHWPVPAAGPNSNSAALFTHYDDGSAYGGGQYIAVSDVDGIDNLSNATIAVWSRYYQGAEGTYVSDQASTMMSCDWPGTAGSWYLGRKFNSFTSFLAMTNAITSDATFILSFPDSTLTGDTMNYHHYAVTFDGAHFIGYFDGVPCVTNSAMGIDALRIGGSYKWLGLSCWPHGGTAQWGDDDYPNAGWMNGAISDVRIYNRRLSGAEIQTLVAGGPVTVDRPIGPSQLRVVTAP